jgi:glycine cleavage system regulatory protein
MSGTISTQDGVCNEPMPKRSQPIPTAVEESVSAEITQTTLTQQRDDEPRLGFAAIWLDQGRRKMTISFTGIDRSAMMAYVAQRLKVRGINIESGFRAQLEQSTGTFFEIAGEPDTMQHLYDEITQNQMKAPQSEDIPTNGIIHELEVLAPDRSGILSDIAARLDACRIETVDLVIKTKKTSDGRKGIVYARIAVPSQDALATFEEKLREINDFPKWHYRCGTWDRTPRLLRTAGTGMDNPN